MSMITLLTAFRSWKPAIDQPQGHRGKRVICVDKCHRFQSRLDVNEAGSITNQVDATVCCGQCMAVQSFIPPYNPPNTLNGDKNHLLDAVKPANPQAAISQELTSLKIAFRGAPSLHTT